MWYTKQDFENDIWTFSEIQHGPVDEPPPPTILEYKQSLDYNTSSIFDPDNNILNEDLTYVYSGRGRGVRSTYYTPGTSFKSKDISEEEEIRRKIRQETGHIGYDEIIQQKYKAINRKHENKLKEENVIFQDVIEPTTSQTVEYVPAIHSPKISTPKASPSKCSTPNSILFRDLSPVSCDSEVQAALPSQNDSPLRTNEQLVNGEKTVHPPPLSVIMKRGKKKVKQIDNRSTSSSLQEKENFDLNETHVNNPQNSEIYSRDPDEKRIIGNSSLKQEEDISADCSLNCRKLDSSPSNSSLVYWWRSKHAECINSNYKHSNKKSPSFDVRSREDFPPL